jgi:hypothetical protein
MFRCISESLKSVFLTRIVISLSESKQKKTNNFVMPLGLLEGGKREKY